VYGIGIGRSPRMEMVLLIASMPPSCYAVLSAER
jgi:hypothetical protein